MTEHLLRQIRSRGLDGTRIPDALLTLYEGIAALQLGQLERAEAKRQALAASAFDFANLASNRKALHVFNVGLALAVGRTDEASGLAATLDENEQFEGSLHAMIVAEHPGETTSEQLRSWTQMRPALDLTVHTLALTQAQAFVTARLTPLQRRLRVLESQDADIVAAHDFQLFRVAGDWVDLTDHPTTSTLLEALMGADEALSFEELGAQLYPGEVVEFSALKNRVNVQLSKLRKLGLKPFISKQADGFTLDGTTFVESSETDLK